MPPDAPAKFSGVKKDKAGREYRWVNGRRVPVHPRGAQARKKAARLDGSTSRAGSGDAAVRQAVGRTLLAAAGGVAAGAKLAAKRLGERAWSRLSPESQKKAAAAFALGKAAYERLEVFRRKGKEVALQAARERGLPERQVERVGRVLAVAEFVGSMTQWLPAHAAADALGAGAVASFAASKVASLVPVASLAYLAYSTARDPYATVRAARKVIAGQAHRHQEAVEADTLDLLFHGCQAGGDWFEAIVAAALDESHDLGKAARLAWDALQRQPSNPVLESYVEEIQEHLAALLESGFTGVIKDSLGRTIHYRDGKRVKGGHGDPEHKPARSGYHLAANVEGHMASVGSRLADGLAAAKGRKEALELVKKAASRLPAAAFAEAGANAAKEVAGKLQAPPWGGGSGADARRLVVAIGRDYGRQVAAFCRGALSDIAHAVRDNNVGSRAEAVATAHGLGDEIPDRAWGEAFGEDAASDLRDALEEWWGKRPGDAILDAPDVPAALAAFEKVTGEKLEPGDAKDPGRLWEGPFYDWLEAKVRPVLRDVSDRLHRAFVGRKAGEAAESLLEEAQHAPRGGVSLGGKHFKGGEFIPDEYLKSKADRDKLAAAKKTAGGGTNNPKGDGAAERDARQKRNQAFRTNMARRLEAPGRQSPPAAAAAIREAFRHGRRYNAGPEAVAEAVGAVLLGSDLRSSGGEHGFDTHADLGGLMGEKAKGTPLLVDIKTSRQNGYDEKPDAKLAKVREWEEKGGVAAYLTFAEGHGLILHLGIDPASSPRFGEGNKRRLVSPEDFRGEMIDGKGGPVPGVLVGGGWKSLEDLKRATPEQVEAFRANVRQVLREVDMDTLKRQIAAQTQAYKDKLRSDVQELDPEGFAQQAAKNPEALAAALAKNPEALAAALAKNPEALAAFEAALKKAKAGQ